MNVDVVKQFYSSIASGDIPTMMSLLSPEISWSIAGPASVPYFGSYRGLKGVEEFFARLDEAEEINEFAPTEFFESGDTVFVRGAERCTSRKTGRSFSSAWIHIFHLTGGRIDSFEEFIDTAAVAAAYA
ncbi:MAG TPA: nuclear transport factor 2 family protein [Thermoanaerobaculia bacterium]|jgi:ketosteroid isomerase-like protein